MIKNIEELKREVAECLFPLNLDQIIIFGSYANGEVNHYSDLDLYVVTKDNFIPATWRENKQIYLKISQKIKSIRDKISIDLIVHTKELNKKFLEQKSVFSKQIYDKGIHLL